MYPIKQKQTVVSDAVSSQSELMLHIIFEVEYTK